MKNNKKLTKSFLFIASLSILLLLSSFTGLAQWEYPYYSQILSSPFNQNSTNFNWQGYSQITNPLYNYNSIYNSYSNYGTYQYGKPFSAYNMGYLNYNNFGNFGLSNYMYSNLGNYQYLNPVSYNQPFVSSMTTYYNTFGYNMFGSFYTPSNPFVPGYNIYSPFSTNYIYPYISPYPMQKPSSTKPAEDEYLAIVPEVLHAGDKETISVTLFGYKGTDRGAGMVGVSLLKSGEKVAEAENYIIGKGTIELPVPYVDKGEYELEIKGEKFKGKASVSVVEDLLIFLQTDKPIYQPKQIIHIRVITLDSELKPVSKEVVLEALDAKGIKIFRKELATDEYGMAVLDLPISGEPNLGVWKLNAASDQATMQLDVRVEKYVLPKYEVKTVLSKEWFLVNEPVTGSVKAEYSFGKPVKGELVIIASRYVGEWEIYETFYKEIDGEAEFEIAPVGYVAGVPSAGGMGNIKLDIAVKERNTLYEEKTNKLITVSSSPLNLKIIPESSVFKPTLPLDILIISETPDNKPRDAKVSIKITFINEDLSQQGTMEDVLITNGGKAIFTFTPPEESIALVIEAEAEGASASKAMESGYSPSGNFIHIEQISQGIPKVGEQIRFKVHSTNEAVNFYFEVISRDKVIFSDFTGFSEISFQVTPMMAPQSRLLVYQILPNSEVAADYLPFEVEGTYPQSVSTQFSTDEVRPGEDISIMIEAEGKSRVGLAAVDKSVFILAEKRLNLQQVFEELERLYMKPQAELHSSSVYSKVNTKGAKEIFKDAGVLVLSNKTIPEGKEFKRYVEKNWEWVFGGGVWFGALFNAPPIGISQQEMQDVDTTEGEIELAQIDKIRQFFPETWLWQDLITDNQGYALVDAKTPDSITTWMFQTVALSKDKGLGICEDELKVFQPFFIKIDLPYSSIRGEEFPVRISIYNYLDEKQEVFVEIKQQDWFQLLEGSSKTVEVEANDLGSAQFKIKPIQLGVKQIEVTARSVNAADAVIKTVNIIPEGIEKEYVKNLVIDAGETKSIDTHMPAEIVEGSGRAYIAATSSYLTQTIEGLEELLKMPSGCGEQNMIYLAPDIYISRYLKETGQIKPEIMAKAEKLMITGYQRELTYRHNDGSFSAFGENDEEGSLWLTAFVLKVFSQARGLIYIDDNILKEANNWIISHQNDDGSFDTVGFLHHKEMMGGLAGKTALTAFTVIAMSEVGGSSSLSKAVGYLEGQLEKISDAYTMALVAYALELTDSSMKDEAYEKLMGLSQADEDGLYWPAEGAQIEATGYGMLALIKHGDKFNAGRAAKWLVSRRNSYGGFSSTQDTVVALEALTEFSMAAKSDVDLKIEIKGREINKEIIIGNENFDVLQVVELPINEEFEILSTGEGEAVIQIVRRFNLPAPQNQGQVFNITVDYDTAQVEVNDLVSVMVSVGFNPPSLIESGMVVLDISVPTGFTPVTDSLDSVLKEEDKIKRYEIAGRKVIFYIENMLNGEVIAFMFKIMAMYPVKAKGVASQAYSYYKPEMKGETLGKEMVVLDE